MQGVPSDENDHTGSFSSFTPCGAPSGKLRRKISAGGSHQNHLPMVLMFVKTRVSPIAMGDQGSAFGNRNPFEKGLTENFYGYSSTLTASPRWNEYSTASVTGSPSCRRTIAAYSFSCKA